VNRYFLLIILVTQLFACTSVGSVKLNVNNTQSQENTEKILAIQQWQLLGRLSVRHHRESWLTKLDWRHDFLIDDLTLSTSLGGVVAKLMHSKAGVEMLDEGGVMRPVSERELQSALGYVPPWAHLPYWVRGVVSPKAPLLINNEQVLGEDVFSQDGWEVRLGRYEEVGGIVLPGKVYLSKDGLKIKLIVDEWLM